MKNDKLTLQNCKREINSHCFVAACLTASKFMAPPEPAEHYEWEEVILDEAR